MRCDSLHKHIAVKLLHLLYCKKGQKELRNWMGSLTCRIARGQTQHTAFTQAFFTVTMSRSFTMHCYLTSFTPIRTFLQRPLYRSLSTSDKKCRKYGPNFKYSNKYDLQSTDFHETQKFHMESRGHLLQRTSPKPAKKFGRY